MKDSLGLKVLASALLVLVLSYFAFNGYSASKVSFSADKISSENIGPILEDTSSKVISYGGERGSGIAIIYEKNKLLYRYPSSSCSGLMFRNVRIVGDTLKIFTVSSPLTRFCKGTTEMQERGIVINIPEEFAENENAKVMIGENNNFHPVYLNKKKWLTDVE